MGSEEPSALFFVADGAAKERVQCRDSQRKKKQRLKVHTKCSETWKNGFELKKKDGNTQLKRNKIVLQK